MFLCFIFVSLFAFVLACTYLSIATLKFYTRLHPYLAKIVFRNVVKQCSTKLSTHIFAYAASCIFWPLLHTVIAHISLLLFVHFILPYDRYSSFFLFCFYSFVVIQLSFTIFQTFRASYNHILHL